MNARKLPRDPNRKPWFWGFVGRTALATLVAWATLVAMSLVGLLLFGGAILGLLGLGSSTSGGDTSASEELPDDFPSFTDMPSDEITPTPDPERPVLLKATSDVPAEVTWSIGNERATEPFTGEWTKEGVSTSEFESYEVTVTPVDGANATTTCSITVAEEVLEEGSASNDSMGTYCYA